MKNICIECGKQPSRSSYTYCSNKCQREYQYKKYLQDWQEGKANGGRGIQTRNISEHVKRYLIEKYSESCSLCGWNKKHSITCKVPLEIDHIDGDPENNCEANLRLLCPNCHSLTLNYRNLNSGNGRGWRRLKYVRSAK